MFISILRALRKNPTIFQTSHYSTSSKKNLTEVTLHLWPPNPERKLLAFRNTPLAARWFSGGETGHLSMSVIYEDGNKSYISIWPGVHTIEHEGLTEEIEPIIASPSLEFDINSESRREPISRTLRIDDLKSISLKENIQILWQELNLDPLIRDRWSVTNNCSTFICRLLYKSGIIINSPTIIETPTNVFAMFSEFEQEILKDELSKPLFMR